MSDIVDAFQLQIQADEQVTAVLKKISAEASKGVNVGVHMTADVTSVLNAIDKVAKELQSKVANGTFDFNDLFNLKGSISQLGGFADKFKELTPIFNALNTGANTLTSSMTKIASLKLEAGKFQSLQTTLSNIDKTIGDIASKLGVANGAGAFDNVEQGAKEAAQATEELSKVKENADAKMNTAAKAAGKAQVQTQNNVQAEMKETLATTEQIEQAYQRMRSQSEFDRASISRTLNDNYSGTSNVESSRTVLSQLKNAHDSYDLSIAKNWNWEQQYQWVVKFVRIYEEYGSRADHTNKSLSKHTELYNQLKPNVESYKQSLQAVLDLEQRMMNGGNTSAPAKPLQQAAQEAATTAANVEKVEQNLTDAAAKAEVLEQQMADVNAKAAQSVTGKVDIGNTVKVTGDNGQLALEKTLRGTYRIQQQMVKIMAEINAKMVSGANAATASYEQLRTVMQETVEAGRQLGAAESKQKEPYALMKQELTEILRLKKLLPNAGEAEKKIIGSQINELYKQASQHQKIIDKANERNAVEQQTVNLIRNQIKLQEAANKTSIASGQKTKLETKYNSARNALKGANGNTLINTPEAQQIQSVVEQFRQCDLAIAQVHNNFKALNSNNRNAINQAIKDYERLTVAQREALKEGAYNAFNNSGKFKGQYIPLDQSQISMLQTVQVGTEQYKNALIDVAEKATGFKMVSAELDATGTKLVSTYYDQDRNLRKITTSYNAAAGQARQFQNNIQMHEGIVSSVFKPLGNKIKEIFRYFSAYMIVMRFFNAFKQGIQYVKELNTALTEMQLVTESTSNEMARVEKEIQKIAASVASTNVDIAKSATDWAKLGYNMSDALALAGVSAQYAKVGFTDVATASENLTATMQAFYSDDLRNGLVDAGELAESLTDKFVDVGNKFASSAQGLGQGMTAASAALVAAGEHHRLNYMETCCYRTHLIAKTA